ncbi:hypothetical protein VOLCADRAFT_92809 [Volvox carteri f. nagariensis]|uniref:Uncharacterized protein n=1 Tax=Volvox carteri f. nagariensis TaxID=3068 RepID=D8U0I7_VOLCA|nr:uncharacterized protein VOLCADRAFT_92809 [Volvox carteri f. nagariensis]EFJ46642.1 hypothetical protein VOLCADRAFT_92809 [Volvox carteri f. nagariensis]|eukprot:XP_002952171.1 hypothetical protein VOLCADRAFT_92809 [Volvox carteri f. nagariensis]
MDQRAANRLSVDILQRQYRNSPKYCTTLQRQLRWPHPAGYAGPPAWPRLDFAPGGRNPRIQVPGGKSAATSPYLTFQSVVASRQADLQDLAHRVLGLLGLDGGALTMSGLALAYTAPVKRYAAFATSSGAAGSPGSNKPSAALQQLLSAALLLPAIGLGSGTSRVILVNVSVALSDCDLLQQLRGRICAERRPGEAQPRTPMTSLPSSSSSSSSAPIYTGPAYPLSCAAVARSGWELREVLALADQEAEAVPPGLPWQQAEFRVYLQGRISMAEQRSEPPPTHGSPSPPRPTTMPQQRTLLPREPVTVRRGVRLLGPASLDMGGMLQPFRLVFRTNTSVAGSDSGYSASNPGSGAHVRDVYLHAVDLHLTGLAQGGAADLPHGLMAALAWSLGVNGCRPFLGRSNEQCLAFRILFFRTTAAIQRQFNKAPLVTLEGCSLQLTDDEMSYWRTALTQLQDPAWGGSPEGDGPAEGLPPGLAEEEPSLPPPPPPLQPLVRRAARRGLQEKGALAPASAAAAAPAPRLIESWLMRLAAPPEAVLTAATNDLSTGVVLIPRVRPACFVLAPWSLGPHPHSSPTRDMGLPSGVTCVWRHRPHKLVNGLRDTSATASAAVGATAGRELDLGELTGAISLGDGGGGGGAGGGGPCVALRRLVVTNLAPGRSAASLAAAGGDTEYVSMGDDLTAADGEDAAAAAVGGLEDTGPSGDDGSDWNTVLVGGPSPRDTGVANATREFMDESDQSTAAADGGAWLPSVGLLAFGFDRSPGTRPRLFLRDVLLLVPSQEFKVLMALARDLRPVTAGGGDVDIDAGGSGGSKTSADIAAATGGALGADVDAIVAAHDVENRQMPDYLGTGSTGGLAEVLLCSQYFAEENVLVLRRVVGYRGLWGENVRITSPDLVDTWNPGGLYPDFFQLQPRPDPDPPTPPEHHPTASPPSPRAPIIPAEMRPPRSRPYPPPRGAPVSSRPPLIPAQYSLPQQQPSTNVAPPSPAQDPDEGAQAGPGGGVSGGGGGGGGALLAMVAGIVVGVALMALAIGVLTWHRCSPSSLSSGMAAKVMGALLATSASANAACTANEQQQQGPLPATRAWPAVESPHTRTLLERLNSFQGAYQCKATFPVMYGLALGEILAR